MREVKPTDADFSIYMQFPMTEIWNNKHKYDISFNGKESVAYKRKPGEYRSVVSTSCLMAKTLVFERDKLEKEFKVW